MATPISIIDQPSFWAAFLLTEVALPMIMPNKRWAGFTMLLTAGVFYADAKALLPSFSVNAPLRHGLIGFLLATVAFWGWPYVRPIWRRLTPGAVSRDHSAAPLIVSADEDANIVDQRLYYIELGLHDEQLTGPQPYIDFYISFINGSIFELTWEHEIKGLLHLDGHPLQQPLVIAPRDSPQSLQTARGRPGSIAIRQWLTRDNVTYMSGREEISIRFRYSQATIQF